MSLNKTYNFWFRPELAETIAQRYANISLNEMLAMQPRSPEIREMWESTALDELYVSAVHLGVEQNQPLGCEFEVQVVQVSSNAPHAAVIALFQNLGGFYVNSR